MVSAAYGILALLCGMQVDHTLLRAIQGGCTDAQPLQGETLEMQEAEQLASPCVQASGDPWDGACTWLRPQFHRTVQRCILPARQRGLSCLLVPHIADIKPAVVGGNDVKLLLSPSHVTAQVLYSSMRMIVMLP